MITVTITAPASELAARLEEVLALWKPTEPKRPKAREAATPASGAAAPSTKPGASSMDSPESSTTSAPTTPSPTTAKTLPDVSDAQQTIAHDDRPDVGAPSLEVTKAAVHAAIQRQKRAEANAVLASFGVDSISKLSPSQRAEFITKIGVL